MLLCFPFRNKLNSCHFNLGAVLDQILETVQSLFIHCILKE